VSVIEGFITLIHPGETKEEDEKTSVIATITPLGRDEFVAAGQKDYKASNKFEVWANEFDKQPELEYNGDRLTIYRTYGPKPDDKIELYTAERAGNR
jgi:hypothetical protein